MTTQDCEHVLRRLPVVDFSATYGCERCQHAFSVPWLGGMTIAEVDQLAVQKFGGTVGEPFPAYQPPPAPAAEVLADPVRFNEWLTDAINRSTS